MPVLVKAREFVMDDVSWDAYTRMLEDWGHGATRMTYDQGELEIMTTSGEHEHVKKCAARLLELWAVLNDVAITGWGNVTLRRRDLQVGLEPDECYYVQSAVPPIEPGEVNLNLHAPPDLAIEVEVSRSSMDKVSIYARLGVAEVWRWTGEAFVVLARQTDGTYAPRTGSGVLSDLPMEWMAEFTLLALREGQPASLRALRERLRRGQ